MRLALLSIAFVLSCRPALAQDAPAADPTPEPTALPAEPVPPATAAPEPEPQPEPFPRMTASEAEIDNAIAAGLRERGKQRGLILRDTGRGIMNAMSRPGDQAGSGFWLHAHTPLRWISQLAANAAKEYRPFSRADLRPEDYWDCLRVVANPDTPNNVTRSGVQISSSVQHVVIRDETRRVVVQPRFKDEFQEDVQNAMGAKLAYQGVRAVFSMDEVKAARDVKGEFIITVVGEREKDFKVKTKHLPELPGLAK